MSGLVPPSFPSVTPTVSKADRDAIHSVLVTGAHGFLGSQVARYFGVNGSRVTGIGHEAWSLEGQSDFKLSVWHSGDITLDALVTYGGEPDVIVHCAGSGSVAFSMLHPFQDYARTVTSTAAVLEYIRLHSRRTALVYPSSAAVYGVAELLPIEETAALQPASPYGTHKVMAEQLCRSYADNYGLSVAIVRFFSIYGEGLKKQLLWDACEKIARGENMFFGSGAEMRDWLHVEDAAHLIRKAAINASNSAPIVNGGSGVGVTIREILEEVFRAFGSSDQPCFNGSPRPGDPPGYQANMKIATDWGWSPNVDWREGVRRYVAWYRSQSR